MSSALNPLPYRVEARYGTHSRTPWQLVTESASHDEARQKADDFIKLWPGQCARIIAQHVIERIAPTTTTRR